MPRAKKTEPEVTANEEVTTPVEPTESPPAEGPPPETGEPVTDAGPEQSESEETVPAPAPRKRKTAKKAKPEPGGSGESDDPVTEPEDPKPEPVRPVRKRKDSILTIESGDEVETPEDQKDLIWHEILNARRTKRVLTGMLTGMERAENGMTVAVIDFKGMRVIVPLSEMMIHLAEGSYPGEMLTRQTKILGNSIGSEVDFIVKGTDTKTRSVVASRQEAMLKKRKLFYFDRAADGQPRVREGRVVQARVIAVAEKVIRVDVFGIECPIFARDLTYDWIGDAHERYNVGDEILVRVLEIDRKSIQDIYIKCDAKSVSGTSGRDNLKKCRIQGKYAGTVTDIHKGVVYIRLGIGVNAVAHSCYDRRMPGKKDEVSFAVTHLDEEHNVAVGIITRIIKQHL